MILYCKNCGSEIEVNDGEKIVVCDFCGMEQTVPKADDPQKLELFIKANEYRMASRFDVAKKQYEKIIAEYPDDNEAYWCKLLCEYGIEYVEDILTEKKLPTCHRTVKESIFDNKDYKLIMGRATAEEKAIYESEAKEIDRIQKEILAKAEKEEPFDIFICYKETENDGKRRTLDAQHATKIYTYLTEHGYKVFFSRITLKGMLGSEYEPIIYSALNSAKVMLHVSTSVEHTNAPWVRNEWSRFLEFMNSDVTKTILPCIAQMGPYELPEELAKFQVADITEIDFYENLIRQIDSKFGRVTATQKPESVTVSSARIVENATQTGNNATIQPLLKRIQIFLADKEWNEADEYCEKVLDIDPECVEAYLGKLLAELKVSDKENLKSFAQPFDTAKNYKKVLRYADNELKKFLENTVDYIKERNENTRKQGIYDKATQLMLSAKTESDYKEAINLYKFIIDWKDSKEQIEYCKNRIEEVKAEQIAAEQATEQAVKQLEKRCKLLVISLDEAKSKEEIENTRKEAQRSLDKLLARNNNLAAVLAKFPTLQEQINKANNEIEVLEKNESMLTAERAKLGFFAIKRKKEIDEEVLNIESKKFELKSKKQSIGKETLGYKTIGELERDIEKTQSEIEEAKKKLEEVNKLQTKDEIIAELKKTTVGKKYYEGTIEYKKESLRKAGVGETVKFGSYYQSNNTTKEDIEWQVLSKAGNKLLLISKYALDCKRYNTSYTDVTWETCTLRKWLNNEFINEAFNGDEKSLIPTVTVSADKNPNYSTNPGNSTQDKVFLLSIPEANKYFSTSTARQCKPTAYAKKNGAWENTDNGNCWWWLRSPGNDLDSAAYVYNVGDVSFIGLGVHSDFSAVRPALWVNLE